MKPNKYKPFENKKKKIIKKVNKNDLWTDLIEKRSKMEKEKNEQNVIIDSDDSVIKEPTGDEKYDKLLTIVERLEAKINDQDETIRKLYEKNCKLQEKLRKYESEVTPQRKKQRKDSISTWSESNLDNSSELNIDNSQELNYKNQNDDNVSMASDDTEIGRFKIPNVKPRNIEQNIQKNNNNASAHTNVGNGNAEKIGLMRKVRGIPPLVVIDKNAKNTIDNIPKWLDCKRNEF